MDAESKSSTRGAQSLRRALAVLRLVAETQERGIRLVDLVAGTGLNRPTVHRMLQVLREEGVVEQDGETRRYRVGAELALLGMARGSRFPIRGVAEPFLYELAAKVGDTVFLTIRQGGDSVAIDRVTGNYPIQVLATETGVRRPLGAGVAGVVILASLPGAEATALAAGNARRLTRLGLTVAGLQERVEEARALGYAWAPMGVVPNTSAVAVPVVDELGKPLAAVTVAAMADRLSRERLPVVVTALRDTARRIARRRSELDGRRAP
ncbi:MULTISPECIES: IclR family transcriptional regulator [Ramlibacter]|uniref:Helix-turn-helix domain-containing protein n=1 Tax=Ramlibacter pinisoli TaxID=2682844 RepID=A0A6N8ISX5_9BURK|nr:MULTISPECIES: IclR family transcriptional regulator [Ramlibacter]MBA2964999.1 IclR family transcriptional regulator [Ramlibacter sp. CGMCC 1.13660]MVQ29964.1 helix-turn-helix domain-containing protein [Ramlibacter pinisoli]